MAQSAGYAAHSGCALSSDDAGENRALASNAQKPHPARELLSARRPRSPDQCVRRVLQPPALSREHRQSYPGRRLLRTRSNHPAGKRKDQTKNHQKSSVASQQASRITSIQDAPDSLLDQAASCLKISDDGHYGREGGQRVIESPLENGRGVVGSTASTPTTQHLRRRGSPSSGSFEISPSIASISPIASRLKPSRLQLRAG